MNCLKPVLIPIVLACFAVSCAVISEEIRKDSIGPVSFQDLLEETEKYIGATVILGGYILETKHVNGETTIKVLQAPLAFGEEPKSKDYSEGRFIVLHKGFLDPEVYAKDRQVTVGGTVIGSVLEKIDGLSRPYLKIQGREVYLWPERQPYYPVPYYDPWYYWYYPFPYYRHHHYSHYW